MKGRGGDRQIPFWIIDRSLEIQTIWRKRWRSCITGFALNDFSHPFRRLKALADGDQAAHDVANHVMQKGIAFKLKPPVGSVFVNIDTQQGFDGR